MYPNRRLLRAIQQKNEQEAIKLIDIRCLDDDINSNGDTAILLACKANLTNLVLKLLQQDANPYYLNRQKESALSISHKMNNLVILEAIHKSYPRMTPDIGNYILDAVEGNSLEWLRRTFQKAGKDVIKKTLNRWLRGKKHNSALHLAYEGGNKEMIELLLSHGADPEYKNVEGKKPAELAAQANMESATAKASHDIQTPVAADLSSRRKDLRALCEQYRSYMFQPRPELRRSNSTDSFLDPVEGCCRETVRQAFGRM